MQEKRKNVRLPIKLKLEVSNLFKQDGVKIENMLEQNRALIKKYEEEKKEMGMMSVSAGDGISSIFKDLMVDSVIEGGQSMNT